MQSLSARLVQARKNAQLTRDEVVQLASDSSGFSRSSLQDWEQEGSSREPKLEYLFDLARIYGVHPWLLLSGETLVSDAKPENLDGFFKLSLADMDNQRSDLAFGLPNWWLSQRHLAAEQLLGYLYQGDTMSPTISDNAVVIVDKSQNSLVDGAIYALLINAVLFIRRIQRLPDGIRLISDNVKYTPLDIGQSQMAQENYVEIIGQVVFAGLNFEKV